MGKVYLAWCLANTRYPVNGNYFREFLEIVKQ